MLCVCVCASLYLSFSKRAWCGVCVCVCVCVRAHTHIHSPHVPPAVLTRDTVHMRARDFACCAPVCLCVHVQGVLVGDLITRVGRWSTQGASTAEVFAQIKKHTDRPLTLSFATPDRCVCEREKFGNIHREREGKGGGGRGVLRSSWPVH